MNLTSPSQVREWCLANGFRPNRTMGQNFLVDLNVLKAIVDAGLAPCAGKESPAVLEIGPGLGVMTEELLARGCRVTAVEKDPALAARLAAALGNPSGLSVVEGDALDVVAGRGGFSPSTSPPSTAWSPTFPTRPAPASSSSSSSAAPPRR